MGLYDRFVVPRLIDLAMRDRRARERRERLVPKAHGRALEVGIGSGLNLAFYDRSRLRSLCAVDPSAELLAMARKKAKSLGLEVELAQQSAERLPFPNASFDCVLHTWTLCSIPDPAAALAEMRRVLTPGGELFFIEHGLSSDPGVARWQQRLTPLWRPLAGGCHLDRRIDALMRDAFDSVDVDTFYLRGPRILTYMYEGCAKA